MIFNAYVHFIVVQVRHKFKILKSHLTIHLVGFHRYILENFKGDTLEGITEKEVKEFDPPSEVSIIKVNSSFARGSKRMFFLMYPTNLPVGSSSDRGPITLYASSLRKIWDA